jgi:hypothetical protein
MSQRSRNGAEPRPVAPLSYDGAIDPCPQAMSGSVETIMVHAALAADHRQESVAAE